ncbi:manganese efflux pump MntP family protein [Parolsenella catena]|uniref:manganese efflux pump MntP n=1 Tax=Parolsenella catena TaxID=2003188 RepID=UPI0029429193|nr:manganese efflux pump [Parolsenella catena]
MELLEIIVLGVALSADAFAVTISNTFVYASESRSRLMLMPLMFGLFQGLMPVAGYLLGGLAAEVIETYAGVITLVILGLVGGNMIREGVCALRGAGEQDGPEEPGAGPVARRLTLVTVLAQAIATAIDAFAVGVSLRAQAVSVVVAAPIIALTTFLCCVAALALGRKLGEVLGDRAQVAGGIVLVLIGLKAFLA